MADEVENPFDCEGCESEAEFWVYERWEADDGVGAVESDIPVCRECVAGVEPQHIDGAYANYEFRVEPVAEAFGMKQIK